MNTTWSNYLQTTQSLYISREQRFREDNQNIWLPYMKICDKTNVLEVGCAGGYMLHKLKQIFPGIQASGIDLDDNHIMYAREKSKELNINCDFLVADALALPFKDNSFDTVFSHNVIEHLPVESFLQEQHRVLKKGGNIVVMSTKSNMSIQPKHWKRSNVYDEILKKRIRETYAVEFEGYETSVDVYPGKLESCGFENVDVQFCMLMDYAPDNYSTKKDLAEEQINAQRRYALDSFQRICMIEQHKITKREKERYISMINAHFDNRLCKYRRGEKVWDLCASAVMFVSGIKV